MGWRIQEYLCEPCRARMESLEETPVPETMPCPGCGAPAEKCISAPKGFVQFITVARGKSDPMPPRAVRTDLLADGMKPSEWKAHRRKLHRDHRIKQLRREMS